MLIGALLLLISYIKLATHSWYRNVMGRTLASRNNGIAWSRTFAKNNRRSALFWRIGSLASSASHMNTSKLLRRKNGGARYRRPSQPGWRLFWPWPCKQLFTPTVELANQTFWLRNSCIVYSPFYGYGGHFKFYCFKYLLWDADCMRSWTSQHKSWNLCLPLWFLPGFITRERFFYHKSQKPSGVSRKLNISNP